MTFLFEEGCSVTLSLISFVWPLTVISRRVIRFITSDSSSTLLGGASEHQDGEDKHTYTGSHLQQAMFSGFLPFCDGIGDAGLETSDV